MTTGNTEQKQSNAADPQGRNEAIVMPLEAEFLIHAHTNNADYARDCAATQRAIANKEPLYQTAEYQTKEDWLTSAAEWEKKRKFYRERARFWKKYLKA